MEPVSERIFPDLEPSAIVYRSADIVVVDKPAGAPTQAPSPEEPEDLVSRLRRALAREAGAGAPAPYLGVHQRLDRDTSGLVLFTLRREANAPVAAAFEGRQVKKTYIACVESRGPLGARTLRDTLDKGDAGRMEVVRAARGARGPREDARGKLAITHVNERARRGARAEVELSLETGRTHQARVQLAHAGAPIAGDRLYDGARAPRLLLHASRLELPAGLLGEGTLTRFHAKTPPAFARWLARGDLGRAIFDDDDALREALATAREARFSLGRSADTTCFRLVNEGGDALPHLAVDVYDAFAVVQLYDDGEGLWEDRVRVERVLDAVESLGFAGVYLKYRPRQANTLVDTRRDEVAPRAPVRGVPAADELVVLEDGVPLGVSLGDGLSTGLFLDQRRNRRLLRLTAGGLRVLNLFAYTCGFSVAAAVGGARQTVSVDAAAVALARGRDNLVRAGHADANAHLVLAEDAFAYLARAAKKGERFDVVVLDPPSYSTSKKRRFVAEQHYGELAAEALRVLAPGGRLFASTNHRGTSRAKLRRVLFAAAEAASVPVAQLKDLPPASDFPATPGEEPTMKAMLLTAARDGAVGKKPLQRPERARRPGGPSGRPDRLKK